MTVPTVKDESTPRASTRAPLRLSTIAQRLRPSSPSPNPKNSFHNHRGVTPLSTSAESSPYSSTASIITSPDFNAGDTASDEVVVPSSQSQSQELPSLPFGDLVLHSTKKPRSKSTSQFDDYPTSPIESSSHDFDEIIPSSQIESQLLEPPPPEWRPSASPAIRRTMDTDAEMIIQSSQSPESMKVSKPFRGPSIPFPDLGPLETSSLPPSSLPEHSQRFSAVPETPPRPSRLLRSRVRSPSEFNEIIPSSQSQHRADLMASPTRMAFSSPQRRPYDSSSLEIIPSSQSQYLVLPDDYRPGGYSSDPDITLVNPQGPPSSPIKRIEYAETYGSTQDETPTESFLEIIEKDKTRREHEQAEAGLSTRREESPVDPYSQTQDEPLTESLVRVFYRDAARQVADKRKKIWGPSQTSLTSRGHGVGSSHAEGDEEDEEDGLSIPHADGSARVHRQDTSHIQPHSSSLSPPPPLPLPQPRPHQLSLPRTRSTTPPRRKSSTSTSTSHSSFGYETQEYEAPSLQSLDPNLFADAESLPQEVKDFFDALDQEESEEEDDF